MTRRTAPNQDETTEPASRRTTVARTDHRGWTLVIPRGWSTLSTDPGVRSRQVRRLLDRRFSGVSRDEVARARHELAAALEEQLAKAAEQGARQLHVQTQPVRGVPVSASLVVALVGNLPERSFPAALDRALGGADGVVEHGEARAGDYPALRRLRRVRSQGGPEGTERWETIVDYVVELNEAELLVLTFATTTEPVAGPMVLLFDAIASSLRPTGRDARGSHDLPEHLG